jgi:hypothetical protein
MYTNLRGSMVHNEMVSIGCLPSDMHILIQLALVRYLQELSCVVMQERIAALSDRCLNEVGESRCLKGTALPSDQELEFHIKDAVFTKSAVSETVANANVMYTIVKQCLEEIILVVDLRRMETIRGGLVSTIPPDQLFFTFLRLNSVVPIDNLLLLQMLTFYFEENLRISDSFLFHFRHTSFLSIQDKKEISSVEKHIFSRYIHLRGLDEELMWFLIDKMDLDPSTTDISALMPCVCHSHCTRLASKLVDLCLSTPTPVVKQNYRRLRTYFWSSQQEAGSSVFQSLYTKELDVITNQIRVTNIFTGKKIRVHGNAYNKMISKMKRSLRGSAFCEAMLEIEHERSTSTNTLFTTLF